MNKYLVYYESSWTMFCSQNNESMC